MAHFIDDADMSLLRLLVHGVARLTDTAWCPMARSGAGSGTALLQNNRAS